MRVDEVEKLVTAFYEGNTSVEEEKKLLHYFRTTNVPEHLLIEKDFFLKLATPNPEVPENLKEKLIGQINTWSQEEKNKIRIKSVRKTNRHWISGIAAGILLILSIWAYVDHEQNSSLQADTYTNPEDAYKETQKALLLISQNLNKGVTRLETVNNNMEKIDNILNKQLDHH